MPVELEVTEFPLMGSPVEYRASTETANLQDLRRTLGAMSFLINDQMIKAIMKDALSKPVEIRDDKNRLRLSIRIVKLTI